MPRQVGGLLEHTMGMLGTAYAQLEAWARHQLAAGVLDASAFAQGKSTVESLSWCCLPYYYAVERERLHARTPERYSAA